MTHTHAIVGLSKSVAFTSHRSQKSDVERFRLCCIQDVPVQCLIERQNYHPQCVW